MAERDGVVEAVLENLAGESTGMAEAARMGLAALTRGASLEAVTQQGLSEFLWQQLPATWSGDLAEQWAVAEALGRVFELLDMPRYAAICDGAETVDILTAYAHNGPTAGRRAYRKAADASGVRPPDVPDLLTWGQEMGADEASAHWAVSATLELSILVGDLVPGARGWRRVARRVTTEALTMRRSEFSGGTWLELIHAERRELWAHSLGSARGALALTVAAQLTDDTPIPADAEAAVGPVTWLVEQATAGAALTRTGNLARAVVTEGARRFGWSSGPGLPRSESDVLELWTLRRLAEDLKLVRRWHGQLVLTPTGRALAKGGTAALWQATSEALFPADHAQAAAAEIVLMMLLPGEPVDGLTLTLAVAEALTGEGWHDPSTGQPIPVEVAELLPVEVLRRLDLLNLTTGAGSDSIQLTATGIAAAHTALRARALGPRADTP